MSVHALDWAFTAPKAMPSCDKFILVALADHADPEGLCYPSWGRLARMTNLHRTTIYRSIERLEHEWGVLSKVVSGGGKKRSTNLYRLHVGPWRLPTEYADHEIQPTFDPAILSPSDATLFAPFVEPESMSEDIHNGSGVQPVARPNRLRGATGVVAHSDSTGCGVQPEPKENRHRTAPTPPTFVGTAVDNSDETWHLIPDEVRHSGLAHVAAIKDQLASRPASTDALEDGGGE